MFVLSRVGHRPTLLPASKRPRNEAHPGGPTGPTLLQRAERSRRRSAGVVKRARAATDRLFQAQVRGVERASKRPRNEAHPGGPAGPTLLQRAERSRRRSAGVVKRAGAPTGATFQDWSGKRDSNPRLRPWQGRTLPLSYSRSPRPRTAFTPPLSGSSKRTTAPPGHQPDSRG